MEAHDAVVVDLRGHGQDVVRLGVARRTQGEQDDAAVAGGAQHDAADVDAEADDVEGPLHGLRVAQRRLQGNGGSLTGVVDGAAARRRGRLEKQEPAGVGQDAGLDALLPPVRGLGGAGLGLHQPHAQDGGQVGVVSGPVPGNGGVVVPDGQDPIEGDAEAHVLALAVDGPGVIDMTDVAGVPAGPTRRPCAAGAIVLRSCQVLAHELSLTAARSPRALARPASRSSLRACSHWWTCRAESASRARTWSALVTTRPSVAWRTPRLET